MHSATLTSLAMLKVDIDHGNDYLDYLKPFIIQVLFDHNPDPVTDQGVCDYLRADYGLEIPTRTVQIVLKRIVKLGLLVRSEHVYRIKDGIADPSIYTQKAKANRHIQSVISGLQSYSRDTIKPILSNEEAVNAIISFLDEFSIPCLKSFIRGTAIPTIDNKKDTDVVLVSHYVLHIQESDPERFKSFIVMLQGHMLANALLCPDLQNAPKSYKEVTFYLDTPLLVRWLGVEGKPKEKAITSLINLLHDLGAKIAIFDHTREELDSVIRGASEYIDAPDGRGPIVEYARGNGITKSDLLLLSNQIDKKLTEVGIGIIKAPVYSKSLHIDEGEFEEALFDEVFYLNPVAKEHDLKSVGCIYYLRRGISPKELEKAKAVLVTSNTGFAKAAYAYGQAKSETKEVSAVINDFSLANMAWLKAPMAAIEIPTVEVLAFSFAALQPPQSMLNRYVDEIDKLEKSGDISERDHQFLRSSVLAHGELMKLTLGEEDALSGETIIETLKRAKAEIQQEAMSKLKDERELHDRTKKKFDQQIEDHGKILKGIYLRCDTKANRLIQATRVLLYLVLIAGVLSGFNIRTSNKYIGDGLLIGSIILGIMTMFNLALGFSIDSLLNKRHLRIRNWLIKREAKALDIDLSDISKF